MCMNNCSDHNSQTELIGDNDMKLKTHELSQQAWRMIESHESLNGFSSQAEFLESFIELVALRGGVDGDGSRSYLCRRTTDLPFQSNNCQIVHLESENDWNSITHPAFQGATN